MISGGTHRFAEKSMSFTVIRKASRITGDNLPYEIFIVISFEITRNLGGGTRLGCSSTSSPRRRLFCSGETVALPGDLMLRTRGEFPVRSADPFAFHVARVFLRKSKLLSPDGPSSGARSFDFAFAGAARICHGISKMSCTQENR